MSNASDTYLGLQLDEGSAFFVEESARSESGAASISRVKLETFKFMGSTARFEYLMPESTNIDFGMQAFENHVPDFRLKWAQFLTGPSPKEAVMQLDEFVSMAGGATSSPCMRVIPGYGLLQTAYKSAEGMMSALYGVYEYRGFIRSKNTSVGRYEIIVGQSYDERILKSVEASLGTLPATLSPRDMELLAEIQLMIKAWRSTTSVHGDTLGGYISTFRPIEGDTFKNSNVSSLLARLGAFAEKPAWYKYQVKVADDGHIVVTTPKGQSADATALSKAFPELTVPWSKSSETIRDRVIKHNEVLDAGEKPKVEPVGADEINQAFEKGSRVYFLTKNSSVPVQAQSLAEIIAKDDFDPDKIRYYSVSIQGLKEYLVLPAQVKNTKANKWFMKHHSGNERRAESFVKSAAPYLEWREALAISEQIVPAMVNRFNLLLPNMLAWGDTHPYAAMPTVISQFLSKPSLQALARTMSIIASVLDKKASLLPKMALKDGSLYGTLMDGGYTLIGSGRYAPNERKDRVTALIPIVGRGISPMSMKVRGDQAVVDKLLDVAVILEEPPATLISPVRAMIMTSALFRILDYFDGKEAPPGYNFDKYDESNPTGMGQKRPSPHALLNRQLARYEQGLAQLIENATVEQMPDILRNVNKLIDAKIFLNGNMGKVMTSIIERSDWQVMLQSFFMALLSTNPTVDVVSLSDNRRVKSITAGVPPRTAAAFIFGEVLNRLTKTKAYRDMAYKALLAPDEHILDAEDKLLENQIQINKMVRGEMLLQRARNGAELLVSLLNGSNPLVPNIHVGTLQNMVDADHALNITEAMQLLLNKDYLGLVDSIEYEAPWETAEWATQFSSFGFSVRSYPIQYEVLDVATEAAADSGLVAVSSALNRVGFDWKEIAPSCTVVRLNDELADSYTLARGHMMGTESNGGLKLLNNAPIAHQSVKITRVMPSFDKDSYNLLKAYLTMNTSRTYFAQPIDRDVSDILRITCDKFDPVVAAALGYADDSTTAALIWDEHVRKGIAFERTPALADVALIMPYVSSYLTKPVLTRDKLIVDTFDIDTSANSCMAVTTGVVMIPSDNQLELLSPEYGIPVVARTRTSISTALPWIGS